MLPRAAAARVRRHLGQTSALRFRTYLCLGAAAALLLLGEGLRRAERPVRLILNNGLNRAASSPLPYHAAVPRLAGALAGSAGWRAVVRVDSAGAGAAELCGAADAAPPLGSLALDLSRAAPPACLRAAVVRPAPAEAARIARELAGARWVLLDPGGRVAYSARSVPPAASVGELAALLAASPSLAQAAPGRQP